MSIDFFIVIRFHMLALAYRPRGITDCDDSPTTTKRTIGWCSGHWVFAQELVNQNLIRILFDKFMIDEYFSCFDIRKFIHIIYLFISNANKLYMCVNACKTFCLGMYLVLEVSYRPLERCTHLIPRLSEI